MPPDELRARFRTGLAAGELSERDAAELADLKNTIEELSGFHCAGYKEKCLRRRLAVRMRARGVHGYADYGGLLGEDPEERRRLLDAVTINVSKFFRNREVWDRMRAEVLPALLALDVPEIRIWSAGCAAGEEIYSVAMTLLEAGGAAGMDSRVRLLATDIDRRALEDARHAVYSDLAFGEILPEVRQQWFEGPDRRRLRAEVRRLVRFDTLDLMRDPFPADQHLILCRNVVIYFERAAQNRIFLKMHDVLANDGYLVLGKVETLFGATLRLYRTIAGRERIFRRA